MDRIEPVWFGDYVPPQVMKNYIIPENDECYKENGIMLHRRKFNVDDEA